MKFLALSNILELKQEVDILSLTVSTFMTLVADNLFLWKMQPRGEEIHYRLLRKKGLTPIFSEDGKSFHIK